MAIGDTDVELEFTNIVVNVPIVVGIQNTGVQTEILVRYGIQRFTATLGVDYSLIFPVDLLTFQLTPTQSLIDKLTAAGPTNVIYIQRVLPLTSDFDYDNAFVRQKLVDEFNRVWMVLQQEDFRLGLASPVTSWNDRTGDVHIFLQDITDVGGAQIASPHFTGVPTAPTAAPATDTTQLATTQFVNAAVEVGVTLDAVTSFNGRQGNVNLLWADLSALGAANLASPVFTGDPKAPTPSVGDNDTSIATTAFVNNAVAAISSGVVSWNGRVGIVTMTSADITAASGALLSQLPVASAAIPIVDGTGVAGVATAWARGDHVHPTDTSRLAVAAASAVNPVMDSAAAPGVAASYSRGDHVHPSDTSRVAKAGDTMTGNLTINPAAGGSQLNLNPSAAGQNAFVQFAQSGVVKWQWIKAGDDSINLYDGAAAANIISIPSNGVLVTFSRAVSVPANSVAVTPAVSDNSTKIATTAFVFANGVPAGTILAFAGNTTSVPTGWFACNGQNINRAANPTLFNLFNTMTGGLAIWGVGDGSTTFAVPDLRGRVPAGIDSMGGAPGAAGLLATGTPGTGGFAKVTIGGFGGEQNHNQIIAELAQHAHPDGQLQRINPTSFGNNSPGWVSATGTTISGNNGSGTAFNVTQPTLLVNYIIRGG